jgi:hypothetical protein
MFHCPLFNQIIDLGNVFVSSPLQLRNCTLGSPPRFIPTHGSGFATRHVPTLLNVPQKQEVAGAFSIMNMLHVK